MSPAKEAGGREDLQCGERLAVGAALGDVVARLLVDELGVGAGVDADGQPLLRQLVHQIVEAVVLAAHQRRLGQPHAVEEQAGRVEGPHPDLLHQPTAQHVTQPINTNKDHLVAYLVAYSFGYLLGYYWLLDIGKGFKLGKMYKKCTS